MYQLEIVKDDDETNEAVERHQLQYSELHRQQMLLEEQTEKETKNYMDLLDKADKNKKDIEQAAEMRLKKILAQKQSNAVASETALKKQQSLVEETASRQNESGSDGGEDEQESRTEVKPEVAAEAEAKAAQLEN